MQGRERDRGFTLIELLVALIVVAVLAGVAIPVYLTQRKKAVDAGLRAEVRSVALAQETWLADNPGQVGTVDPVALVAAGHSHTAGNQVWVYVNTAKRGYAVMARSTGDSTGGTSGYSVVYDSLMGGLRAEGRLVQWTPLRSTESAIPTLPVDWVKIYDN